MQQTIEKILTQLFVQIANEDYSSATFGKVVTLAEKRINEVTFDDTQNWEIVTAEFFKPMMIDKFMHKLIRVFQAKDELKIRCCSPKMMRDEIIKPKIEVAYNDF